MKKNILIVAAHPDDEVLGVGGTAAGHADRGDDVYVLILADGEGAGESADQTSIQSRKIAAKKASDILGFQKTLFHDFADNQMDRTPLLEIIKVIENHFQQIKPDIVYTHHGSDLNIDHQITFEAVITASRPIQGSTYPKEIYCFETLSSTEWGINRPFIPNTFIDISGSFDKKNAALEAYAAEMRAFPHPRSYEAIKALAHLRGSQAALKLAEAFYCIRSIKD